LLPTFPLLSAVHVEHSWFSAQLSAFLQLVPSFSFLLLQVTPSSVHSQGIQHILNEHGSLHEASPLLLDHLIIIVSVFVKCKTNGPRCTTS